MIENKTIALIAHDRRKSDMIEWVKYNKNILINNKIVCTGTTGILVEKELLDFATELGLNVNLDKKQSGPFGGDAEIASMVVNKQIDFCVFLIDDLNANAHEADIQMLLRQCRVHNIPVACNRHTADLIITSSLWNNSEYKPTEPTYKKFERI